MYKTQEDLFFRNEVIVLKSLKAGHLSLASSASKFTFFILITFLLVLCSLLFTANQNQNRFSSPNAASCALSDDSDGTHENSDSKETFLLDPESSASSSDSADISAPLESSQTTSEIFPDVPPEGKFYIEMKNILQKPELPTGCEATALAIVLNFLGFDADKCEIVDHYMPKTTKLYSMNTHFIGNPYKKDGIGCYAPVVAITAENYFRENVITDRTVRNITGATPDELYCYVSLGQPVICWATINMTNTYVAKTWIAEDTGETVEFYLNEHATVLVGYDTVKKTVTLNDPWRGIVTYSMELFEKRYKQLGQQAIIIR